jgi:hypothetical protein
MDGLILFPVLCVIIGERSDIRLRERKGKGWTDSVPCLGVVIGDHVLSKCGYILNRS